MTEQNEDITPTELPEDITQPVEDASITETAPVDVQPVEKKKSVEKIERLKLYNKSFDEIDADVQKIVKILNKNKKDMTDEEIQLANSYEKELEKDDSCISRLFNAYEEQRRLYEGVDYLTNVITKRIESNSNLAQAEGALNHRLNKTLERKVDPNEPLKPVRLQGKAGKKEMMHRLRGVCRIPLLNSGFWITIRSQSLIELNSFFESVDIEEKIYGRLLGGHYYLFYDHYIKQTFMDMITNAIVDSSLKGYDQSKVFEKALSLNDYDVLVGAACFLLFRNGIYLDIPCIHEGCGNIETVEVDLSKIRYNDLSLLDEYCIESITSAGSETLTLEDLEVYRSHLKFNPTIVEGDSVITCEVPSMNKYLRLGSKAIAKLTTGVHGNNIQATNFASTLNSLAAFTYIPWIKKIEMFPNTPDWTETSDTDLILDLLENLIYENYPVLSDIQTNFITNTKISFLCYPGTKCSKCGGSPNGQDVNYQPADVQLLFFYLSTQTLQKPAKGLKSM